ncbi:MAG: lysophospholipid acyltransferase family protein [Pseudomonadota bacterium]|nr:lysophospholipid acyltransferase family protein [Pseudomonadota bacterium]
MISLLRLAIRLSVFTLFLAAITILALALRIGDVVTGRKLERTPWAGRCFRGACRCLGLHIRWHGPTPQANTLMVSNHISWCDIPILGGLAPVRFLSKAEVAEWPLIGWLARQAGTLFIRRGGGQARQVKSAIRSALASGESVLIFPEGTTSAGLTVLPFHGLLLNAAREANVMIQPATICYRRDGRPDHVAPFIGDDAFHSHLIRLLKNPASRVDVLFHEPVAITGELKSSELARQIQETVLNGLHRLQAGEMDLVTTPVRTGAAPGLSRLR